MSTLKIFSAFLIAAGVFASAAHAQSTFGSITGTVSDPTGAAVPGTSIAAVHKTAGLTYTTQSNEAGVYTLPDLRDGAYTIRASKPDRKSVV